MWWSWEKKKSDLPGNAKISSNKQDQEVTSGKQTLIQPCGCSRGSCGICFLESKQHGAVHEGLAPLGCDAQRTPQLDLVSDTAFFLWACVCLCVYEDLQEEPFPLQSLLGCCWLTSVVSFWFTETSSLQFSHMESGIEVDTNCSLC